MFWQKYGTLICTVILGLLAGIIIGKTIWDINNPPRTLLSPLGQRVIPHVVEVIAEAPSEEQSKLDPLSYIRWKGQQLGYTDYQISKFIRVARCESGFKLNPNAKNPDSTATGIFQIIIGTWDGNLCEGERWDFVDNIDCAYKIYAKRGLQPWNASKNCWNK